VILVRELSAKGSRGRRDWRQEVVAQRMARGRKRLPRERVEESDGCAGKMEKKTARDGEWPSDGYDG